MLSATNLLNVPPPIKKGKSMTGYLLFSAEIRKTIQAQNPTSNFGNISKLVGLEWHKLNEIEKKEYDIRAEVLAKEKQESMESNLTKSFQKPVNSSNTNGTSGFSQKYMPEFENKPNTVQLRTPQVIPVSGEYRVEDLFRCQPKYAVIQLEAKHNTVNLFKQLLAYGYKNVRFFDDLSEHPTVKVKIEKSKENPLKTLINGAGNVEIPEWKGDILDTETPTTFQIQMVEKIATKAPKRNSTGASSTGSISSTEYDQTIEQVASNSFADPNFLVTSLFSNSVEPEKHSSQSSSSSSNNQKSAINNQPGPDELVKCKLCDSMIMATRFSNLTNHVRRHASLKQYQCPNCSYQNNEQAKVRLHMQNQHSDAKTAIIDKISNEMQKMWDKLMGECFPNYAETIANAKACQAKRLAQSVNATINGQQQQQHQQQNQQQNKNHSDEVEDSEPLVKSMVTTRDVSIYRCLECSHIIPCVSGQEPNLDGPLCQHLRSSHTLNCFPWKCNLCDYKNAEQWKIRLHILNNHFENAEKIAIDQIDVAHYDLFIKKFFHNAKNIQTDPDEYKKLDIETLDPSTKRCKLT